ncbi:MAG: TrkA family potassium uptake protein [Bacilli bacterium]|nr:TrkA family potassium uptake protein [Bacilli bacterium]
MALLKNKIIIVGCGRFGSSIANKYSEEGKNIMVVDADPNRFDKLSESFMGYKYVGDGTDISVLKKANIESAKQIIITSGSDNANILIAYIARKIFDVPEIYVRLEDPDSESLIKGLNVKTIFPFELSFQEFKRIGGGN